MKLQIEVNAATKPSVSRNVLEEVFRAFLSEMHVHKKSSVSVAFVSEKEIQKLNKKYRKKNKPTDVLSFSEVEKFPLASLKKSPSYLGEIAICSVVAKKQAEEKKHSFRKEVEILTVHSMLHLLGYDHKTEKQAGIMEALEEKIVKKIKIKSHKTKL